MSYTKELYNWNLSSYYNTCIHGPTKFKVVLSSIYSSHIVPNNLDHSLLLQDHWKADHSKDLRLLATWSKTMQKVYLNQCWIWRYFFKHRCKIFPDIGRKMIGMTLIAWMKCQQHPELIENPWNISNSKMFIAIMENCKKSLMYSWRCLLETNICIYVLWHL